MTSRERQIFCGLFLSRFDVEAVEFLGFRSFVESFNVLGYGLNARPASIKNYRDEFDPYFPNSRKGWHKRQLRPHCARLLEAFRDSSIEEMGHTIAGFLDSNIPVDQAPDLAQVLQALGEEPISAVAKRFITGKAAENYFVVMSESIPEFAGMKLLDTSLWGCGFDFKLSTGVDIPFVAVEVKGIRAASGQIQMTDLEYRVSKLLRDRYYLFVVRNFIEEPNHLLIRDPSSSFLEFSRLKRTEVQTTWNAAVSI